MINNYTRHYKQQYINSRVTCQFTPASMAAPLRELGYGAVEVYSEETLAVGSYGKVCKAKCGQLACAAKLLHDTMFGTHR